MPKRAIAPSVQVKKLLHELGLTARKELGQHFLVDEAILETMIASADISPPDTVIEVGGGLGVLTVKLARQAGEVIAVELDIRLASMLERRLASLPNASVIKADILNLSSSQLLQGKDNYKVVANLPYYVASPILRYFMEASPKPSLIVVTVQKEVAEAIVASTGKMSWLAVSLQLYSRPSIVSYVAAESFYPPPKVDSAIVRFDMLPEPAVDVADITRFLDVVRRGFNSPRKQLRNSLAHGWELKPAEAALLLEEAGLEPRRRAETLGLDEWARLYEVLEVYGKDEIPCSRA